VEADRDGERMAGTNEEKKNNNTNDDDDDDDDDATSFHADSAAEITDAMTVMNDRIDVQLDPDVTPPRVCQRLPPLRNARISISGRARIGTLKKYLIMKLGLRDTRSSLSSVLSTTIVLTCNGDTMEDELTLTCILRTQWFASNKVLTLKYLLSDQAEEKEAGRKVV
jgi:hypothetical protein